MTAPGEITSPDQMEDAQSVYEVRTTTFGEKIVFYKHRVAFDHVWFMRMPVLHEKLFKNYFHALAYANKLSKEHNVPIEFTDETRTIDP